MGFRGLVSGLPLLALLFSNRDALAQSREAAAENRLARDDEPVKERWYGWQPLIGDSISLTVFATGYGLYRGHEVHVSDGDPEDSDEPHGEGGGVAPFKVPGALLMLGGGAGYFVVSPIIHLHHRQRLAALGSLTLRLCVPLAGGVADQVGGSEAAVGTVVVSSALLVSVLDVALISREPVPKKSFALLPTATWDGARAASVGVAGVF